MGIAGTIGKNLLPVFFPLILKAVEEIVDSSVDGKEIAKEAWKVELFQIAYVIIGTSGKRIVKDTENEYADMGIEFIKEQIEDAADEGGFTLPISQ